MAFGVRHCITRRKQRKAVTIGICTISGIDIPKLTCNERRRSAAASRKPDDFVPDAVTLNCLPQRIFLLSPWNPAISAQELQI
jgi:hypothetical protein